MPSVKSISLALVTLASIFITQTVNANLPNCGSVPAGQPCHFTNVSDFDGGIFDHLSFDAVDEQDAISISEKFKNIATFNITGGNGAIRHTSNYAAAFSGADTAGGAVSGEYRIDMGYFGTTEVTVTFHQPVDAVGGFYGGSSDTAITTVFLEDGTSYEITLQEANIPSVPGETPSLNPECTAINGFLGIDSDGGPKIVKVIFSTTTDASSLDSLFFGTSQGGSHGAGVFRFPETLISTNCAALGYPTPPVLPQSVRVTTDSDGDGMPDEWEQRYGLNPFDANDAAIDSDGDGIINLTEFNNGTDPTFFDSNTPNLLDGNTVVEGSLRLIPQSIAPVICSTDSEGSIYYDTLASMLLICDGVSWNEYRGPQGETGTQGAAGPEGKTGAKGEKGDKGDPGKGAPFANIQCSTNQIIRYNGSTWECAQDTLAILTRDCRDGDTIMFKSGTWQCAPLPGQGIGRGKRKHEHENKSAKQTKHKNHSHEK